MKVAFKLISCLILGVIALVAIDATVSIHRETRLFRSEMQHDARMLGYTIKDLVTDVWRSQGQERALTLIEDANREEQRIRVRWVWLNASNDVAYRPHVSPARVLDQLGNGSQASLSTSDEQGRPFLYTYILMDVDDPRVGAIELSEPMAHLIDYTRRTVVQMLSLAVGLIVCGAIVTSVLGFRFIGRPLDQLMVKLRRIGQGDLSGPLALRLHDEFGDLANTLDKMCEDLNSTQQQLLAETARRIKTLEELRHADRLSTVGRLSAGVAHELGTPLNVIAERARIIQEECGQDGEVSVSAQIIEQQSDHMANIVRQLLDFSRRRPSEKETTDLRELTRETVEMLRPLAEKREVRLHLDRSKESVNAFVFKRQIQQVLINLIDNAVEASPRGGSVTVQVVRETIHSPPNQQAIPGDYAKIDVRDQGGGISAESVVRIFEPFFTTKDVGEGTGLGLSIAYSIVDEHGGWIDVSSVADGGTCFSAYVPSCTPAEPNRDYGKTTTSTRA